MKAALTALVMDGVELSQLEAKLAQFNLFRILKADRHELRHSNMLGWLFDPAGSHGLADTFLRRWLMQVMLGADGGEAAAPTISPVWIDTAEFQSVRVQREWNNLDVLITFDARTLDGVGQWVVAIENKVDAQQGEQQLERYRKIVEASFPEAAGRFYVFLTKSAESPNDPGWLTSTYADVLQALERCVAEREDSIGSEPLFLIRQYLELLREDFMDDSESVQLARAIYQRHAAAIDYILECKSDPLFDLTSRLEKRLAVEAVRLGIVMAKTGKGRIRFLPREWDIAQNTGGTAWGDSGRFLLLEADLYSRTVELNMVLADAPEAWADAVWERCGSPPLQRSQKNRPRRFIKAYRGRSGIQLSQDLELDQAEDDIFEWIVGHMRDRDFQNALGIMTELLISRAA